jgi:hypothetical protein
MPTVPFKQTQPRRSLRQHSTGANYSTTGTQAASTKTVPAIQSPRHPGQPQTMTTPTRHTTESPSTSDSASTSDVRSTSDQSSISNAHSSTSSASSPNRSTSTTTNTQDSPAVQTPTITHKTVNHQSTNRRQCKRLSDDLSRSTPDQNNLSQRRHSHCTRLTLKITCPSSGDAEEMILAIFSEFIEELTNSDPTAAILPWKSIHRSKGSLSKATDVPKNLRLIRPYLNKFFIGRTPNSPFTTYPGIHIGHNKSLSDLREDMQMWIQDGDHGLYYKMLQVEDSTEIGWLLYSTKEMDAGALVDEISDLVGVKVGLRWKIIDVGAKGKLPESQRIRALNVEVNSKYRWDAQRKLIEYFGRNLKDLTEYPNGIRLRFVKNKKDAINAIEKGKIDRLRARQNSFLQNIISSVSWDIVQLDYSPKPSQPTLRQMIMSIKSKDDVPLFHCVDLDWRGDGFVFQYSPVVKVEAECTINTLLPLLKHKYPDADLDRLFTSETEHRCEGLTFDESKGAVVDNLVNDHLTFLDEENLLGFSFTINPDEPQTPHNEARPSQEQPLYNDSDSVSTLAKPGQASFITPSAAHNQSFSRIDTRSNDNTSVTSGTSTVTMETISTIENRLTTLTTHIQRTDKKFDDIMNYLISSNSGGSSTSATNQHGTAASGNSEAGEDTPSISGRVP